MRRKCIFIFNFSQTDKKNVLKYFFVDEKNDKNIDTKEQINHNSTTFISGGTVDKKNEVICNLDNLKKDSVIFEK